MFGTNEIVGQKFFKDAAPRTLFVTSMFFTLQGEGPYNGMPALFIRLTKCNLDCSFCDTFFDDGDWMTYEALEMKARTTIDEFFASRNKPTPSWAVEETENGITHRGVVLVITGGEPTLQKNLSQFLKEQLWRYQAVQIESNGTQNLEMDPTVTLVCSPKCLEKEGKAVKYLAPTKQILERADCLKFVMSAQEGNPYNTIPDWAHEWKARTGKEIFVSPMNVYNTFPQKIKLIRAEKGQITMDERSTVDEVISFWEPGLLNLAENQKNHEYAAAYAMEHGLRLNLQMHLYASLA
jgi:7-carboxy-7-deazaguanine synthase